MVDALDEYEEISRNAILSRIRNIFFGDPYQQGHMWYQKSHESDHHKSRYESIRIKLSPYTIIQLKAEREETLINQDITAYISHEVGRLATLRGYTNKLKHTVEDTLVTGANRMFLEMSLVLAILETTPVKSVLQRVEHIVGILSTARLVNTMSARRVE